MEGRLQECFEIFDQIQLTAKHEFQTTQYLNFYRTAAELRIAVNRKQVGEASSKLDKLLALQEFEGPAGIFTLTCQVEVYMSQGNHEQVPHLRS